ncbi:DUF362 domain-containing protein [candidate division KSB1 bacterium]|nr:DUF362 domain-containing protein [candidate division KSB1 bacterium]
MNRRNFIKNTITIGSGLVLGGVPYCQGQAKKALIESTKSRVVVIRNPGLTSLKQARDSELMRKLLDQGLRKWFNHQSTADCWREIARPNDVVGIKVNCLAGKGLSTHPELVAAIIEGLKSVDVKEKNIIVWDRLNQDLQRAGFTINTKGGVKFFGNDVAGYSSDLVCYGAVGSLVSKVVTDYCSVLINVPILKDHGIVGVSVALKNYFGAIHNPNKYHDHIGDPYVADVNMFDDIRQKTQFTICDALVAQYEGGPPFMPQWAWPYSGLIFGKDMVAIDQIGWEIIEEKRRVQGLKSLKDVSREPTYIAKAASADYQLGFNNRQQIELIEESI